MAVDQTIRFAAVEDLFLDPMNPRLGRNNTGGTVKQDKILKLMSDWKLDELAVSFLENGGFWTQEALIVVQERLYGATRLTVVEGNRRLAALILLQRCYKKELSDKKWLEISRLRKPPAGLFTKVPYLLAENREDVESFIGFRHVTGIEEWRPAEKAEYITKLIDKGFDYKQVMRKIGSKANAVRQNYISYKLLLEIEKSADIPEENFQDRFSVMYLSLRTEGVQTFLNVDVSAEPHAVRGEIPKIHKESLKDFALWMFGDEDRAPLFKDSRQVDNFGRILQSKDAIAYLKRSENPSFEVALRTAGGDEPEVVRLVDRASDGIELALTRAHHYTKSKKLQLAVERFLRDANQLGDLFPTVKAKIAQDDEA